MHGSADQVRMVRMVRAHHTHGRSRPAGQIFQFLRFRHFARNIPIVNSISILFSPTHSNYLNLSNSTVKSCFHFPKQLIPIPPKITYFSKMLKTTFSIKT